MGEAPGVRTADLDRLAARLARVRLAPEERRALEAVMALARDVIDAREVARTAGLTLDSAPVAGELADVPDAFRRAFAPGPRARIVRLSGR